MAQCSIIPQTIHSSDFPYVMNLWRQSFPKAERCPEALQIQKTSQQTLFRNCLLSVDGRRAGMLSFWTFPSFRYIEHFAIEPSLRGGGVGSAALREFLQMSPLPVVLEVEQPITDEAVRRIAFYRRAGFQLWHSAYEQPSYGPGRPSISLKIMAWGGFNEEQHFQLVKSVLYKEVYRVGE
jgi:ribosomal protein S18 acetylase RimI-like enzyme